MKFLDAGKDIFVEAGKGGRFGFALNSGKNRAEQGPSNWHMKISITLKTYNNPVYAQRFFERTANIRIRAERTFIEKMKGGYPPLALVVDAGCGTGRDISRFLKAGLNIVGIDGAQTLLDIGHEKFGIPREFLYCSDLRSTPFSSNQFDGLWSKAVLGYFPFPDNLVVLEELVRITKPDALAYIRVREGRKEGMEERDGFFRFYKYYMVSEIKQLMMKAGFTRIDIRQTRDEAGFEYKWLNVWAVRKPFYPKILLPHNRALKG